MIRKALLFSSALLLTACHSWLGLSSSPQPSIAGAYSAALGAANEAAKAGRYDAADSVLAAFAESHPQTQYGREIAFWRALYRIDPRNRTARRPEAIAALDAYLRTPEVWWYRAEAEVLRLMARASDAPEVVPLPPLTGSARDQEVQQLRARIAELQEELERIRRRLAAPTR